MSKVVQNGQKWSKMVNMVKNGQKWLKIAQNGKKKEAKMDQSGLKW